MSIELFQQRIAGANHAPRGLTGYTWLMYEVNAG